MQINEKAFFDILLEGWFVLSAIVFIALFFIVAPYGRHMRQGWGIYLNNRMGWLVMEAPAAILFALYYFIGGYHFSIVPLVFLLMWEAHYIHRAFIYPFSLNQRRKKIPLAVVCMGFIFNLGNAYLNGRYIFTFADKYTNNWLLDPRFLAGLAIFITGYYINRYSDEVLKNIRSDNETDYRIPQGRFFNLVSSPNYMGEIMIWVGWAVATWSLSGLAFAVWTMANLIPRARSNHEWYKRYFPEYPSQRRALIPKLW